MQQKYILINIKKTTYVILSDISGASSPCFIVIADPDMTDMMVLYPVLFLYQRWWFCIRFFFSTGCDGSVSGSLPHQMWWFCIWFSSAPDVMVLYLVLFLLDVMDGFVSVSLPASDVRLCSLLPNDSVSGSLPPSVVMVIYGSLPTPDVLVLYPVLICRMSVSNSLPAPDVLVLYPITRSTMKL